MSKGFQFTPSQTGVANGLLGTALTLSANVFVFSPFSDLGNLRPPQSRSPTTVASGTQQRKAIALSSQLARVIARKEGLGEP
jgi:hypothetical protein